MNPYRACGNLVWKAVEPGIEELVSEHETDEDAQNEADALNEALDPGNYASMEEYRFHTAGLTTSVPRHKLHP